MEGGEENSRAPNFYLQMNEFSRDLENGFINHGQFLGEHVLKQEVNEEDVELSLGLSMNGRFGVDPSKKKLRRTSSISSLALTVDKVGNWTDHLARGVALEIYAPLSRACSLPTDTEEWRHRKVLPSTMTMEARKKRMEKLKTGRLVKDKEICVEDGYNCHGLNDVVSVTENSQAIENGFLNVVENGCTKLPSQGSIGSQGIGSWGISDIQGHHTEGTNQIVDVKRPSSIRSAQDMGGNKPPINTADAEAKGSHISPKNAMQDMPFVCTKENGSNGNKVEGFLYRYSKGEEVRIVCVCHGMFLSPAEFVKHGGGGDVEHPLKHIVVNPSPLF